MVSWTDVITASDAMPSSTAPRAARAHTTTQSEEARGGVQDHTAKKNLGDENLVHASFFPSYGENEASFGPSSVVSMKQSSYPFRSLSENIQQHGFTQGVGT